MGVHTGLAAPRGRQYVAIAVHQAARVAAVGHGGQVVVSKATAQQLSKAGQASFASLGQFRLRDFDAPVQLFQLTGPGLPAEFPALRALPAERHNLTPPSTTLVGRRADLDGVEAALTECRLVTVVGTGGVGKTRLVVEIGVRAASSWRDGVWLVDLAPIEDPALIPGSVARSVGVGGGSGSDTWHDVLDRLRSWTALLLLDNCEHHTATVASLVASLLGACPGIRVLATSREPLHLAAEQLWRLEPLPIPPSVGPTTDVDTAADSPAVQLFVERSNAVQPQLQLDRQTIAEVVEICRHLDGLPLAIEIAAARMTALSTAEIVAGLDRRFRLLRSRDVTHPERQRSLEVPARLECPPPRRCRAGCPAQARSLRRRFRPRRRFGHGRRRRHRFGLRARTRVVARG
jgi:hypothetical protein